jgi:hypothetical protein
MEMSFICFQCGGESTSVETHKCQDFGEGAVWSELAVHDDWKIHGPTSVTIVAQHSDEQTVFARTTLPVPWRTMHAEDIGLA